MRLEGEFVAHGHGAADFTLGGVFAFDIEFFSVDRADSTVGKVE